MKELVQIVRDAIEESKGHISRFNNRCTLVMRFGTDVNIIDKRMANNTIVNKSDSQMICYLTLNPQEGAVNHINQHLTKLILPRHCPMAMELLKSRAGGNYCCKVRMQAGMLREYDGIIHNTINFDTRRIQINNDVLQYRSLERLFEEINDPQRTPVDYFDIKDYIHGATPQLGFHPTLNSEQTEIQDAHRYDQVAVVIDGGPGTGKTTTLVARINLLTELPTIEKDIEEGTDKYHLRTSAYRDLQERVRRHTDWVFFSPSPYMRVYLADAMSREGLTNAFAKTEYWYDFRKKMMDEYRFFESDTTSRPPFEEYNNDQVLIYLGANSVGQLTDFYLQAFRDIHKKLPKIEESSFWWKTTALLIYQRLKGLEDVKELSSLSACLGSIEMNYSEQMNDFVSRYRSKEEMISRRIFKALPQEFIQQIKDLISNKESQSENEEIDEQQDETQNISTDQKIQQAIRTALLAYGHSLVDSGYKVGKRSNDILTIIEPYIDTNDLDLISEIGEGALLREFAKYTRGAKDLMTAGIPSMYKKFRKSILTNRVPLWNLQLLEQIVDTKTGLHPQEQSLLLGFVNNIVKAIIDKYPNGRYIDAYSVHARPVLGIDEITDFSEVDIYAMTSFALKEYSSITVSGDIMQRLTNVGIKDWNELQQILPNSQRYSLKVSYRQSSKMLALANHLYEDTIHEVAPYTAFLNEERVPEALAYIDVKEDRKIDWIARRIDEIKEIYEKLPSIAVFLNDENDIPLFVKELRRYASEGIRIMDGTNAKDFGTEQQVRVFPINRVKGMEFDAVFFHNIDVHHDFDDELMRRYVYVGITRASFFLGATMTNDLPEVTRYCSKNNDWSKFIEE